MNISSVILAGFMMLAISPAFALNCTALNQKATQQGASYHPVLGKKVRQAGRLYFHSAPNAACKTQVFIIKNDDVVAYQNHNGYDFVMFVSKNGNTVEGWVKEAALNTTGTMGGGQ